MGWGSVLPGHARPELVEAVRSAVALGANFAHITESSLRLAEELARLAPCVEQLRFCASGTEATAYCIRLARAFRGRERILKFEGAYHGAHDVGVASLFPAQLRPFPEAEPTSGGAVDRDVLVAPFNDLETTAAIIEQSADSLAAVIVEPLHRCLPPEPGFLPGLRELCDRHGCLLIFDEVVTGFRLSYGGAQAYYGVVPDLVAYGKALGGGLPIGAFGGRADCMTLASESRLHREPYVWTASSTGGNPVSAAAALAALELYRRPETYPRLHALGRYLRAGIERVLADTQTQGVALGDGPLAQVALMAWQPRSSRDLADSDRAAARQLMLELFSRGVFLNPMGTKLYLSLAHDEAACDALLDRLGDALTSRRSPAA
jgi:glutamate-1-semialdehyde 2,1-aminomutase